MAICADQDLTLLSSCFSCLQRTSVHFWRL